MALLHQLSQFADTQQHWMEVSCVKSYQNWRRIIESTDWKAFSRL